MNYFRLGAQKGLTEKMAFELRLEMYAGTSASAFRENEFGRF